MKVADVMTRGIDVVPPETALRDAATKMAEEDIGAIVVGNGNELVGVLTDRDIILRAVVEGRDIAALRVRDLMSSTVYTCREDDSIEDAFHEMSERQVRRLPVLDNAGRLVGIVTLSDLGRLNRDPRSMSEALREMAEPHRRRASTDPDEGRASTDPDERRTSTDPDERRTSADPDERRTSANPDERRTGASADDR